MHRTMKPQMKATVIAICGPSHLSGWWASTCLIIWEIVRDMTATGPIETSLDVANSFGLISSVVAHVCGEGTYTVNEHSNEGGVEPILRGKGGNLIDDMVIRQVANKRARGTYQGVGHALGDDDDTDGETGDDVAREPSNIYE